MEIMSMLMPHLEISSSTLAMEATLAGNSCNVTNVMLSTVLITVVALIAIPPQIKWDMSYSPGPLPAINTAAFTAPAAKSSLDWAEWDRVSTSLCPAKIT